MTPTERDQRDFVVARWPDLEGVALVVVGDAALAREVTTGVLARMLRRWDEVAAGGRPAEEARRGVLRAALAAAPGPRPAGASPTPEDGAATAPVASAVPWEDDPAADETVVAALADTLRAADPLDRALVAARHVWDLVPEEVAALLDEPVEEVTARATVLRARLATAHDAARAATGLEPAPWALGADLAAAVPLLLRHQSDPPDPAALVAHRATGLRRRQLVLGGVAAAGLVGAAGWVATGAARTTTAPRPAVPAPDDPVWDTTRRWPARGRLAADPAVGALVIRDAPGGSRLLYADDVGDRTVVVASPADISGRAGVRVLLWTGPRGSPVDGLDPVSLARDSLPGVRDVVAVVVAQDVGAALLVLGAPTLREASYAAVVTPNPDGTAVRTFTPLPLVDGVGVELVGRGLGPASFVRAGAFAGIPPGTPVREGGLYPSLAAAGYARGRRDLVAALTGIPGGLLSSRVAVDSPVDGSALDPDGVGAPGEGARVLVVLTRTPDDAFVRSVRLTDRRADRGVLDAESAAVVPAAEAEGPVLVPLPRSGTTERFLVVAPGAARARLFSSTTPDRPVTRFVRCTGAAAVLTVPDARQEAAYRLLLEDDAGARIFLGVPPRSNELA